MERVDRDRSGLIEKSEFVAMMAELLNQRNEFIEFKKVFRMYDNDDDGFI